jgi:hypothetical protein
MNKNEMDLESALQAEICSQEVADTKTHFMNKPTESQSKSNSDPEMIRIDQLSFTKSLFLNKSILINGSGEIGKTTLAKHIYHCLQDEIDHVYYITSKSYEKQIFPYVCDSSNHENINNILNIAINENGNKMIIMDQLDYYKLGKSKSNCDLIMNHRHHNITLIMITTKINVFPPEWRANVNMAFVAQTSFYANIQRLYKTYGGYFPSINKFESVIKYKLEPYEFLMCDNKYIGNDLNKRYFTCIADLYLDEEFRTDNCTLPIPFLKKSIPDKNTTTNDFLKDSNIKDSKDMYIAKELALITDSITKLNKKVECLQSYIWINK